MASLESEIQAAECVFSDVTRHGFRSTGEKRRQAGALHSLLTVSNTPQCLSGSGAGMLVVLDHERAVNKYTFESGGVLVGFPEGGVVLDLGRIEHHEIGGVTWAN